MVSLHRANWRPLGLPCDNARRPSAIHHAVRVLSGGLMRDEVQEVESKIPFLGDIPILGWLFKGTRKTIVKKNLMVFIHPRIMYSDEDNRKATKSRYELIRELEGIYNDETDWLTLKRNDRPLLDEFPSAENSVDEVEKTQAVDGQPVSSEQVVPE